jgi:serine/threonine-protein kinase RsbW
MTDKPTAGDAATGTPAPDLRPGEQIRASVPARTAYVGVLRSFVASVATRLDFDLDHVEDLRLAVSEACAVLLPGAPPDATVHLVLDIGDSGLVVALTGPAGPGAQRSADSFAWTVLRALADETSSDLVDDVLTIRLVLRDEGARASHHAATTDRT